VLLFIVNFEPTGFHQIDIVRQVQLLLLLSTLGTLRLGDRVAYQEIITPSKCSYFYQFSARLIEV